MPELPIATVPRPAVNWRSVGLGLVGTVTICGLTPYNDYALNNTFLVGNNLPLGVIMLAFLFVLGVNGPLSRYRPRWAMHSGELCVALSMTLVSCCLASSGLMRYFPGSLTGPLWHAQSHAEFRAIFLRLNIPEWVWPSFGSSDRTTWFNDPIVTGFHQRWIDAGPIPLAAWVRPAVAWGVFLAALYGAMVCIVLIVRRQWVDNERLPFPLAQIQLAVIEAPPPGRWVNRTFASRGFWLAFAAVFALHGWNALAKYEPAYFPVIPTFYNLTSVFTEQPWSFVDQKLKDAAIFFTVIGVTYYLSSPVAFSLWAFYVLQQAYKMYLGTTTGDPGTPGQSDQHFGGLIAFAGTMLWVGRDHWRTVVMQAIRGPRDGESRGRYFSYRAISWGLVGCAGVMVAWLALAGATVGGAVVIVLLLLFLFLMIGRIIAEVGLVHGQLQVPVYKPFTLLAAYGFKMPVPAETFYLSAMLQGVHYDYREVLTVYGSHAVRMADATIIDARDDPHAGRARQGRRFIACLGLALLVGYGVSLTSMLLTEYTYASTMDSPSKAPINQWGSLDNPRALVVDPTAQYVRGQYNLRHSPAGHFTFGFLFTGLLSFLRLRFTGWPLHPIGYLMLGTFPGAHLWFSIMIGWVLKTLTVRFGGAKMYTAGKPVFLGLIVGEAVAAGFWLVMGIALNALGLTYRAIIIMPG